MSHANYFYLLTPLSELERIVEAHKIDFEELLNDTFSETELTTFEKLLDSISAIFVQPIISELTFDEFYAKENEALKQRCFFEECCSSICVENIADFHTNPFQVTYLIELLRNFDEVLIDTSGVNELLFKKDYVDNLKRYKNIFSLLTQPDTKPIEIKTNKPIDPIDFLILDVYKELERITGIDKNNTLYAQMETQSEKMKKTFFAMANEKLDASMLLKKSGLNAKDFDDNLERLKFALKKII